MGLTMGIVAAPCVGPFVVSLLTYVANLGARMPGAQAAALGGALFFVLALGLGTPFFLVALGAASLRPGEWMDSVKRIFGFIILGVVLWFLRPVISGLHADAFLLGLVLLLISATIYFFVTGGRHGHGARLQVAHRALGAISLVGAAILVGLLARGGGAAAAVAKDGFVAYSDQAVADARAEGRPVVIDFGAEWCAACKELEHQTFPADAVRKEGESFVRLRADLTKNEDPAVLALRKRYSVRGLPTVIFLDTAGVEVDGLRLTGFEAPDAFVLRLKCAGSVDVVQGS
jgi:thiol:disulfide interchange protein DsbD